MKHSELLWIQNMARLASGQSALSSQPTETLSHALTLFLEELTFILNAHVSYFNDQVMHERPDLAVRVFKLGAPRSGIMLLRGKEKLIVQNDGLRLRIRIVQIQGYQEQNVDSFEVDAHLNAEGGVSWIASHDGQRLNPQLLAQEYLGRFLIHGIRAFSHSRAASQRASAQIKREISHTAG
jgi:hypothetical protein